MLRSALSESDLENLITAVVQPEKADVIEDMLKNSHEYRSFGSGESDEKYLKKALSYGDFKLQIVSLLNQGSSVDHAAIQFSRRSQFPAPWINRNRRLVNQLISILRTHYGDQVLIQVKADGIRQHHFGAVKRLHGSESFEDWGSECAIYDEPYSSGQTDPKATDRRNDFVIVRFRRRGTTLRRPPMPGELTPFIYATIGALDFLRSYAQPGSLRDPDGATLAHSAASGWQPNVIRHLVTIGVDINEQDVHGRTPLHDLAQSREVPLEGVHLPKDQPHEEARVATFSALIDGGAKLLLQDSSGANPLHRAAHNGDSVATRILADAMQKDWVDQRTAKGATALLLAAFDDHVECCSILIERGADPYLEIQEGARPIDVMYSSEDGRMQMLAREVIDRTK